MQFIKFKLVVFNIIFLLFFHATLAWSLGEADSKNEQRRKNNCEIVQKKMCGPYPLDHGIRNFAEIQLSSECQKEYENNFCDLIKSTSSNEDKSKFNTCSTSDICDQLSLNDLRSCTINGFKLQFSMENLSVMGLTAGAIATTGSATIGTLIGLPFLIYGASEKSKQCDRDVSYKQAAIALHNLMLRPSEKQLLFGPGEKNESLLKMSCSELKSLLKTRMDVLVQRRSEAKMQGAPLANEVSAFDLALSRSKCFSAKARITSFCEDVSGFVTGMALGAGAGVAARSAIKIKAPEFYDSAKHEELASTIRDIRQSRPKSLESLFLWSNVKKIVYGKIGSPTEITDGTGKGFLRIERGNLDGKEVFIKVSSERADGSFVTPRDATRGRDYWHDEVFWTKKLSDLEIGPHMHGVTITPSGQRAIVTDFVDGVHYQGNVTDVLSKVTPSSTLLENLKNIRKVLTDNNIDTYDLQLIVRNDRAVVIDPEMFSNFKPNAQNPLRTAAHTHNIIDQLISAIEKKLSNPAQ